jgi:SET domain-containing protein
MPANSSWVHPALEVRPSSKHGRGVFAAASIRQGERAVVFGGDVMLIDEIRALPDHVQGYPMQIEERFVLGRRASEAPEYADFINHSCSPNAGFRGQIFLVAMRDIEPGEELTFDYAMVVSESIGSTVRFEMLCACGAPDCRRVITEMDWMRPDLQERYRGYFSQYLQERIDSTRHVSWPLSSSK